MSAPQVSLDQAVERHVSAGDAIHVVTGHSRLDAGRS